MSLCFLGVLLLLLLFCLVGCVWFFCLVVLFFVLVCLCFLFLTNVSLIYLLKRVTYKKNQKYIDRFSHFKLTLYGEVEREPERQTHDRVVSIRRRRKYIE